MKRLLVVLVFLSACEPEIDWDPANNAAIVEVCASGEYKPGANLRSCGAGSFIAPYVVMAALHVVEYPGEHGATGVAIRVFEDRGSVTTEYALSARVLEMDRENDVVLLEVDHSPGVHLPLCDNDAQVGDDVFIASGFNSKITLAGGWVERYRHVAPAGWLYASIPAGPGDSGAPVIDAARGCVTGVVHGGVPGEYVMGAGAELLRELFGDLEVL